MLALARPLLVAVLAIVVSFVATLWISQREMADIEDEVRVVANNSEPSVVYLDAARAALARVGTSTQEYLEAKSAGLSISPSSLETILEARQEVDRNLAAYAALPFFHGEQNLYRTLRDALRPVDRSLSVVLDHATIHGIAEARGALTQQLYPSIEQADHVIDRIVQLDTTESHGRLAAVSRGHHQAMTAAVTLGAFSLGLAGVASAFAVWAIAGEAKRQQQLARERALRAQAETEVRLRDDFLSLASHELRAPVTSMQLAIQSLKRNPMRSKEMLAVAERRTQRLGNLVDELVAVAQIKLGRLRLVHSQVDLTTVVREVVASRSVDADHAHSSVTIASDASVVGRWDRAHLTHLVSNLLSNALKFGAGAPVEIEVVGADDAARLTIRDHGIGISVARLRYVFGLFARDTPVTRYGGLGVGLYVVRALAEAHGGSVRVESELGSGSLFTIELPFNAAGHADHAIQAPSG